MRRVLLTITDHELATLIVLLLPPQFLISRSNRSSKMALMMNRTASLIQMELSKSQLMLRTLKLRLRCIRYLSNMRKKERQNHAPFDYANVHAWVRDAPRNVHSLCGMSCYASATWTGQTPRLGCCRRWAHLERRPMRAWGYRPCRTASLRRTTADGGAENTRVRTYTRRLLCGFARTSACRACGENVEMERRMWCFRPNLVFLRKNIGDFSN